MIIENLVLRAGQIGWRIAYEYRDRDIDSFSLFALRLTLCIMRHKEWMSFL